MPELCRLYRNLQRDMGLVMSSIIERCKIILAQHYGAQFAGLVLYGSLARQTATQSDIDLLVLLHKPFDYFREARAIVDLLYSVQLASDRLISAMPAAVDEFERGDIQLYRNAKREGVNV